VVNGEGILHKILIPDKNSFLSFTQFYLEVFMQANTLEILTAIGSMATPVFVLILTGVGWYIEGST